MLDLELVVLELFEVLEDLEDLESEGLGGTVGEVVGCAKVEGVIVGGVECLIEGRKVGEVINRGEAVGVSVGAGEGFTVGDFVGEDNCAACEINVNVELIAVRFAFTALKFSSIDTITLVRFIDAVDTANVTFEESRRRSTSSFVCNLRREAHGSQLSVV